SVSSPAGAGSLGSARPSGRSRRCRAVAAGRCEELHAARDDLDGAPPGAVGSRTRAPPQTPRDRRPIALVQELQTELGLPVPGRDAEEVGAAVLARAVDR